MDQGGFADRLGQYVQLVDSERTALARLNESRRAITRGTVVRAEQTPARELYLVQSGWLHSSLLMADGRRQLVSLHLPGEFASSSVLALARAPYALVAATDAVVSVVDKVAIRALFDGHPRLATLFCAFGQAERVTLFDRIASLGRTTAKARVAALICDVDTRLAHGGAREDNIALPLTQEEIGDATGLTAVHVNRMMRQLGEDGLIERSPGRIRILDRDRLRRLANYVDRYAMIDTAWLDLKPR